MHLWLDLAAGAARGLQPHHSTAGAIADGFLAWVTGRLKVPRGVELASSAALFLASVEGMLFLEAAGRRSISDAAVTELVALSKRPRRVFPDLRLTAWRRDLTVTAQRSDFEDNYRSPNSSVNHFPLRYFRRPDGRQSGRHKDDH
jgi:hypothetical protein